MKSLLLSKGALEKKAKSNKIEMGDLEGEKKPLLNGEIMRLKPS